ncbi:MAG TPA: hypothetical protein PLE60_13840 [Candidatus Latescibacteria bacterium]|nr:hypothetical protein [Candidatus Latescibacterota bacterium]
MDVSFLFCTATQPALEKRENFDGVELIRPIVAEPSILFEKTRRVHYSLLNGLEPISIGELVQSVCGNHSSALVIFNTKKPTREFYESLKTTVDTIRIYHLSTAMCPDHRKKTIRKIREDLAASIRIIVSSTQLIEAGVDFDFPSVYRALAPMEGIIQAAGRCNREGKMSTPGTVSIFQLDGGRMPDKTYEACAMHAKTMIETNIDVLHRHDAYGDYYSRVISLYVNADKKNINEARKEFNFETVARAYRLMPGFAEGLFVYGYNEESKKLYHEIEFKTALSRDDFRRMQQFTVQVFPGFLKNNAGNYEAKPQGYTVWWGSYDSDTGLPVSPETADSYVV